MISIIDIIRRRWAELIFAWHNRRYCRPPILDHDRALIAAINTARAEAWTETQKLKAERTQQQAYPVELTLDAVTIRAQRNPKGSCRRCHGRGRVGVAHIRVENKRAVNKRAVVICGCVGAWVQIKQEVKPVHG